MSDGSIIATDGGREDVRADLVLLVDIANLTGSRLDGWWRDGASAATSLLSEWSL
jgi:hypothetical protein